MQSVGLLPGCEAPPFMNAFSTFDGAMHASSLTTVGGNPRITLTDGEVFINGTHADNFSTVTIPDNATVRVMLAGIETRDFNIMDVESIRFVGRKGNDRFLNQTSIPSLIFGNEGMDQLSGGQGPDMIWGGPGRDGIRGRGGDDMIKGEHGYDFIFGGDGNDHVSGGIGNDEVHGNLGNDFVTGDAGNDRIFGGAGDDTLLGWHGSDLIDGAEGDDLILGNRDRDTLLGGSGNDEIWGGAGQDTIYGQDGDDTLRGNADADVLVGGNGNDSIYGGDGRDTLIGNGGNDSLYGQDGQDLLRGGLGADLLRGGNQRDVLLGGIDNARDDLRGEHGQDHVLLESADVWENDANDLRIRFKHGSSDWNDAEILVVNRGLDRLHDATGNNRLVTDYVTGKSLLLEKVRANPGRVAALNVLDIATRDGVTTYDRTIRIAEWSESDESENSSIEMEFIHEIAHNFDNEFEYVANPHIEWTQQVSFRALSGWRTDRINGSYSISDDGQWYYRTTAQFYRLYSTLNPFEDWAAIWDLYFDPNANVPSPGSNLGQKLAAMKSFIDSF